MKGTLFVLAALLTAGGARAQAPQYGDLDYDCLKYNTCPVDNTYVDMTAQKLKAEQFSQELEYKKYQAWCKQKGCLSFDEWKAQQDKNASGAGQTTGTASGKTKTQTTSGTKKTKTTGTKTTGTGTTTTTGTGTTSPTTTTTAEDTRTPLQKQWEEQQNKLNQTQVDPNAVSGKIDPVVSSSKEGEGGETTGGFTTKDEQTAVTGNLTVDPKKKDDQKNLLTGDPKKTSDLNKDTPSPETTDEKKPKQGWLSRIFGKKKDDKPITQGPIEGKPVAEKNKDFGNMVGGGKFAAYSGLLAAMFLTGPGALAGIVLFGTIGFFAGYWVTKKNG